MIRNQDRHLNHFRERERGKPTAIWLMGRTETKRLQIDNKWIGKTSDTGACLGCYAACPSSRGRGWIRSDWIGSDRNVLVAPVAVVETGHASGSSHQSVRDLLAVVRREGPGYLRANKTSMPQSPSEFGIRNLRGAFLPNERRMQLKEMVGDSLARLDS